MFDYSEQIRDFIKLNFSPSSPDVSNFKVTSNELLNYLFNTFPNGCINDYELNDILLSLKYERLTYTVETITINEDKEGNKIENKHYHLVFGWCMFTTKIPIMMEKKQ
jgi:hypothetical protein